MTPCWTSARYMWVTDTVLLSSNHRCARFQLHGAANILFCFFTISSDFWGISSSPLPPPLLLHLFLNLFLLQYKRNGQCPSKTLNDCRKPQRTLHTFTLPLHTCTYAHTRVQIHVTLLSCLSNHHARLHDISLWCHHGTNAGTTSSATSASASSFFWQWRTGQGGEAAGL